MKKNGMKGIMNKLYRSRENPLMESKEFYKYCKKRFRYIGKFEKDFLVLLDKYKEMGLLLPVYSNDSLSAYSTFQVYSLQLIEEYRSFSLEPKSNFIYQDKEIIPPISTWESVLKTNQRIIQGRMKSFNNFLPTLIKIQDLYLPEVKSDQRYGESQNFTGQDELVVGGTYFRQVSSFLLSGFRKWRNELITSGKYCPNQILEESGLNTEEIKNLIITLSMQVETIDPLLKWRLLVKHVSYDKRKMLMYEALLAEDLHQIIGILMLFLRDCGRDLRDEGIFEGFDVFDGSVRDTQSKLPIWKQILYGEYYDKDFCKMLSFLTNEYHINPHPRAIIFTEGEEWQVISKIMEFYNYDPKLLGVEFLPLNNDKFNYENWVRFVEYMQEKQTLVYFIIDNENRANNNKKKFKERKRIKESPYLKKSIKPSRIKIWGYRKRTGSFEESNFSDSQIAKALNKQSSIIIKSSDVRRMRIDPNRINKGTGIIEALIKEYGLKINKPKLVNDLVDNLLTLKREKNKTPIEKFLLKVCKEILYNHQYVGKNVYEKNMKSRYLQ